MILLLSCVNPENRIPAKQSDLTEVNNLFMAIDLLFFRNVDLQLILIQTLDGGQVEDGKAKTKP